MAGISVAQQLDGSTILLTGGLGFLGSVCLEQLLRLTQVRKVYLLVRDKKHVTASKRLEQLLCSPLFNMLHEEAASGRRNVFGRVQAVQGDLGFPGLGLSADDAETLKNEVDIIIHCAANLELDAEIQKTLKANYLGTKELMKLASGMPQLRSFLFTSTYFVNNFLPRNSVVREHVHDLPLSLGGKTLNHEQLVQALLAVSAEEADAQVAELMASHNFTSTYAFGKLLTEHLVNETCIRPGVSKVIVRPSLISGLTGAPYPGFITGYAGAPGYMMGYGVGFFHNLGSMAFASDYILDLIPCDTVAALVIAAAAAAAAASGPSAAPTATVYHAASAHCHPLPIWYAVNEMAKFWTANPPPMCLPLTRYVTYPEGAKHIPTPWGLLLGRWITDAKIWCVAKLMQWVGKEREARALSNGFKAFCVQNSFNYNKSIVSAVDNVKQLKAQIVESERHDWQVVFDEDVSDWDTYGYTFFAGVRQLLFRVRGDIQVVKPHNFKIVQPATAAVAELIFNSSSSSSSGRTSDSSNGSGDSSSISESDVVAVIDDAAGVKGADAAAAKNYVRLAVSAGRQASQC